MINSGCPRNVSIFDSDMCKGDWAKSFMSNRLEFESEGITSC